MLGGLAALRRLSHAIQEAADGPPAIEVCGAVAENIPR
jgi:hypothetical protein